MKQKKRRVAAGAGGDAVQHWRRVHQKGVPWTPLAINGARNAIAACITGAVWRAGRRLRWNGAWPAAREPCADNEPVCIRHQAGGRVTLFC